MEVSAVIVARKGSVRIKNKALSLVGGVPMIERKIMQLKEASLVNRIIIGSDCDEVKEIATRQDVEYVRREDYFCDEKRASANEMIGNMCSLIKTDVVAWTHCTNPLITGKTYDNAVAAFLEMQQQGYDSLLSVVKMQEHLWDENRKPLNYNPYTSRHVLAKELPPYYMQDGGIFIQPHQQMLQNSYFFGKNPYLFEVPPEEFLDINNERDLMLARLIIEDKR